MTASSSQQGCDQVVINIRDKLPTAPSLRPSSDCCIHKVPVNLRNINEAAYTPKIISIGPFHHADKMLQPMQVYKIGFLNALLLRKPGIKLDDCVKTLRDKEEQVRNSYFNQEFVCSISSNDFVEMMLLDGCFIVELLISSYGRTNTLLPKSYNEIVRSDLTLYENQLPYFLLEHLFNFINDDNLICQKSFFDLLAMYFSNYMINRWADTHRLQSTGHKVEHILDLILHCHRPSSELTLPVKDDNIKRKKIYLPSATELHESGVEFKKDESDCYLDIKSKKKGVLEIPVLEVNDDTEHRFRNMIAMEQCQLGNNTAYVSHYMRLLDFLINTPEDVALLRGKKIINNYLGSDEEVAKLVNKLTTGVITNVEDSPYYEYLNSMDAFYNTTWNKWKAHLKRKYFHNPWAIASLIAAIVLLICTIAQTVFSII